LPPAAPDPEPAPAAVAGAPAFPGTPPVAPVPGIVPCLPSELPQPNGSVRLRTDPTRVTLLKKENRKRYLVGSFERAVVSELEVVRRAAQAAVITDEHLLGLLVAVELPLPPRNGHVENALGLHHQH
jgi:hypothetical protein